MSRWAARGGPGAGRGYYDNTPNPARAFAGVSRGEDATAKQRQIYVQGADPLQHFDSIGWKEGRMPAEAFDPAAYLRGISLDLDHLTHLVDDGIRWQP